MKKSSKNIKKAVVPQRFKLQTNGRSINKDARELLIRGKRNKIEDAREVIRSQAIQKAGDLRAVLPPKKKNLGDLRIALNTRKGPSRGQSQETPQLVYHDKPVWGDLRALKATVINHRVTDYDREDNIQLTGIPPHMRRQVSPPPPRHTLSRSHRRSPSPGARYPLEAQRRQRSLTPPNYRHRSPPMRSHDRRDKRYSPPSRRSPSPMYDRNSYPLRDSRYAYERRSRSRSPVTSHRQRHRTPTPPRYSNDVARRRSPTPPSVIESIDYGHGRAQRSPAPATNIPWSQRRSLGNENLSRAPRMMAESRIRSETVAAHSNLRMDRPTQYLPASASAPQNGQSVRTEYILEVTSLSSQVSEEDVQELFSDVGRLKYARLIRDGYAKVCYTNREDALNAIDKYHRRELDGIPMNIKMTEAPVESRKDSKSSQIQPGCRKTVFRVKM